MFKRRKNRNAFREAILLYLRFFQEFYPTEDRAVLLAKLDRRETVRVSALELWTEAFNAGLECEEDFRDAAAAGWIFEITSHNVKTMKV